MKPHMKRGLTKVALALMLAGYCAVPAAMAEDAAWVASGTTAEFEGTIPWLYREGGNATINSDDADHIKVTSDGKGTRPSGSETDIPQTNEQARTSLNGSDRNGKSGLAIPANGDGVQGYTLSIIYKHH